MVTRMRYYDIKVTQMVEVASHTTTVTSAAFDTYGWESLTVLIPVGLWTTDETVDFKLTSCATSGGSYDDVAATDFVADVVQVKDAATDQTCYMIAYTGSNRYVKLVGTHGGSGAVIWGAYALQSWPRETSGTIV